MNQSIVIVNNLSKKYDDIYAVNDISFSVNKGEIFGLLGPNGAGKTTTVEILEGLITPDSGEAIIDGINAIKNKKKIRSIIGIQLQQNAFFENLSLYEIIDIYSKLYSSDNDPNNILEKVNLESKKNASYDELSGGQKQRLAIAIALVNDPLVIFLDEPTTGLDPKARRNLWQLIINLRDNGKTIILTTHYMEEAEELCDRVAIIENGKIITLNSPQKLIAQLISSGFKAEKKINEATLDDVFLNLTGKKLN
ncbi:MAG: ABC transporter ATP-binding protein [Dehalococcoidia bacterium]